MSMSDPLADMLTRIRNGQKSKLVTISCPHSNLKESVVKVLLKEGYISSFEVLDIDSKKVLSVDLKFQKNGQGAITEIKKISKPGKRIASSISSLPMNFNGLGIYILSTSKGVISDKAARELGVGGEVICKVF
jgi:small subunit ribosomal protein S8